MRMSRLLLNPQQGHSVWCDMWAHGKPMLMSGHKLHATLRTSTRTLQQNNLMWSCLTDLSGQVEWFGKRLEKKGWKEFITGHLYGQDLIPNMHGTGFISINRGKSTSDMTIPEMIAVIDLCHAFGTEQGVVWSPTSTGFGDYSEYR